MISFVYFCSTSCLRCNQVACISFSILHSISWEEGTTILFIPSIDILLGCSLFIAIMTNAAINILIHVFFAHVQTLLLGICLEVDSWAVREVHVQVFKILTNTFQRCSHQQCMNTLMKSGASLCRGNQCQPCMFYQNRHAVMEVVLELEMWIWDMDAQWMARKMEKKENPRVEL